MKVAFVYPMSESLGIEYLSAVLKKYDHQIKLFIDPILFDNYLISIKAFNKIFSFKKVLLKQIYDYNPDIICFSVVSDYFLWACGIAQTLKSVVKVPIVFGGIHPTSVPERVIKKEFVDYVIVGEGYEALSELINAIQDKKETENIKNVWLKRNGRIISNPLRPLLADLDSLPFPDKDLYRDVYKGFVDKVYLIMCSRGCPNSCSYCYNSYLRKIYPDSRYLRWRSVDNVIEELKIAKFKYKFDRIQFLDDLLIFNTEWLKEFSLKYKKEIAVGFFCFVYPNMLDEEKIFLLQEAGCRTINMGLETLNEDSCKKVLFRYYSNRDVINSFKIVAKSKIFLNVNIMLGLPQQTEEEIIEIARFLNENKPGILSLFWLRYYPKTSITKYLSPEDIDKIEEGLICLPYTRREQNSNKKIGKLANLILISQFVTRTILEFLIKFKIYIIFPSHSLFHLNMIAINFLKRWFVKKKFHYIYFTLFDYIKYHVFFIVRVFNFKKAKSYNE